ncbi:MAG: LbtU family siderophore porin, partial [Deltaproteobacteria bacterium]|nr:LbtU family siderophore porin [Deltaproteobacteria bacterium]
MKKRLVLLSGIFFLHLGIGPQMVFCTMSNDAIVEELRALKQRIEVMEEQLEKKDKQIEELKTEAAKPKEVPPPEAEEEKWYDRIELSGAVEVEFGHEDHDVKDPANNHRTVSADNDDITLATLELGIDAQINKYAQGHVLFLYEEDEDEDRVRIDEGTIKIGGIEETYGSYLLAGKYYPHFGELNSWFVSDPLTLEIFEIRESAAQAGIEQDWFSAGLGVFHGDIEENFEDESKVNGFFADANLHNPEGTLGGLSLLIGASYLSNVADSDTLQDEVVDLDADGIPNDLRDYIDGIAAYFVAEYGKFSFGAEYITALDDFLAGEMGYAVDRNGAPTKTKPAAWNLEFAFRPI